MYKLNEEQKVETETKKEETLADKYKKLNDKCDLILEILQMKKAANDA